MVDDSFLRCFQQQPPDPWNFNIYLFPLWCLGVVVRYVILFPLRCALRSSDVTRHDPQQLLVHLHCSVSCSVV